MQRNNPTDLIDVSFSSYVKEREARLGAHMANGVPDYAYGQDMALRQKMKAIPGLFPLFKAISATAVPLLKQEMNMKALRVSQNQFPEVHEIAVECARRLGIGIPIIFVEMDIATLNAYTFAVEDTTPIIVITTAMLERATPGELRAVIGHECGHIHNNHGIYNTAASIIINGVLSGLPGIQQILQLAAKPIAYALQAWSRAAEVTCDRAAVICSAEPEDLVPMLAKFLYGGTFIEREINVDELLKQYDALYTSPVRFLELSHTHPLPVRRIFALKEFLHSETLYRWRPEWKDPGRTSIGKQELDARCDKYISVLSGKKAGRRSR